MNIWMLASNSVNWRFYTTSISSDEWRLNLFNLRPKKPKHNDETQRSFVSSVYRYVVRMMHRSGIATYLSMNMNERVKPLTPKGAAGGGLLEGGVLEGGVLEGGVLEGGVLEGGGLFQTANEDAAPMEVGLTWCEYTWN
jgi:hypothetical protein